MELAPADQYFRTHSPSFDDLSREKSFTGKQSVENASINISVKGSFTPNRKIIFIAVATITAAAIVSSAVAVTVLFLGSGDKKTGPGQQSDRYTSLSNAQTTPTPGTVQSSTRITTGSTIAPIVVWLEWGSWTICAVTCGEGIQTRYRSCEKSAIGSNCLGDYVQMQHCLGGYCPVYGKWTTWSSWNGCTTSCGGGIQSRTRFCQKNMTSDLDCVGAEAQSQSCNSFICPDCSRICSNGSLSSDCSRCECSITLTGRVLNKALSIVEGAVIRESSNPYIILAETSSLGRFTLNSTCYGTELLVTRTDYQDNFTVVTSQDIEIIMENIVLPYFTRNPTSKYRLSSESVTLCCHADGKPEIKYYEWFKDGNLLNSSLYSNGTHLQLNNLTFNDSGGYMCRANSDAGSRKSTISTLSVRDVPNDFCADAYQQKWQSLPDDCVQPDGTTHLEVGTCAAKSCRQGNSSALESCGETEISCCAVSDFDIVNINCTDYQLSFYVVKGCSCQACGTSTVNINGVAKSMGIDEPLQLGQILLNGEFATRTDLKGGFLVTVDVSVREATITAIDDIFQQFLVTTKIINIPEEHRGMIYISLNMLRKSDPIELSTNVRNTLYSGTNVNNNATYVASIIIPSDSFYYANGTQYNGKVYASLTYCDPSNETALQMAPGRFESVDEEGDIRLLETLGVFTMSVLDGSGLPIMIQGGVDAYMNTDIYSSDPSKAENLKIWGLSLSSGRWEMLMSNEETKKRKRRDSDSLIDRGDHTRLRRQAGFWLGEIDFSYKFYNYDRLSNRRTCYFKVRIFRNNNFILSNEIKQKLIQLTVPVFERPYGVRQEGSISSPSTECFETYCGYEGFIEVTEGTSKAVALIPADPINGSHGIDSQSSQEIKYQLSDNGRALKVFFKLSDRGPFYESREKCIHSLFQENHFRFFSTHINNDIYTFKTKIDSIINPGQIIQLLPRVWYPEYELNRFIACYMRIRLVYNGAETYPIKVRVFSYGGTNIRAKDTIYGIREDVIDSRGSACIEYKCSGKLHYLLAGESDFTRINVIPIIGERITCSVNLDNLADELKDLNNDQVGQKTYRNYMPSYYDNNGDGLFSADTPNTQLEDLSNIAKKKCLDGTTHTTSFSCRDK